MVWSLSVTSEQDLEYELVNPSWNGSMLTSWSWTQLRVWGWLVIPRRRWQTGRSAMPCLSLERIKRWGADGNKVEAVTLIARLWISLGAIRTMLGPWTLISGNTFDGAIYFDSKADGPLVGPMNPAFGTCFQWGKYLQKIRDYHVGTELSWFQLIATHSL